jgi:ribonuclease HII
MILKLRTNWLGVDEAGRGPLAGPVVAAAVLLPKGMDLTGIADSKTLSRSQRECAAEKIKTSAIYEIVMMSHEQIDQTNILKATLTAMKLAVESIQENYLGVLVDGNHEIPGLSCCVEPIIKGDSIYAQIAAAGILAKTTRDDLMRQWAKEFPQYGFERHFGYATPEHLNALSKYGPCPIHRKSFSPCKEKMQPCLTFDD